METDKFRKVAQKAFIHKLELHELAQQIGVSIPLKICPPQPKNSEALADWTMEQQRESDDILFRLKLATMTTSLEKTAKEQEDDHAG